MSLDLGEFADAPDWVGPVTACANGRQAMFYDPPAAVHFTVFRTAREEAAQAAGVELISAEPTEADERMADEAAYYTGRALQEREAWRNAACSKSREIHLELAMAYEFRVHLFAREISGAAAHLYAL